jgi:hypothetical protein
MTRFPKKDGSMTYFRRLKWQYIQWLMRFVPKRHRIGSHDRIILETVIFRELVVDGRYRKVLFVGCAYYTRWYPLLFDWFTDIVFATVEPDPANARFGSKKNHTVGTLETLKAIPGNRNSYDLIILNGVFGFGIDDLEDKTKTFETAYELIKSGGKFLIGYNDIDTLMDEMILRDQCRYDFNLVNPKKFKASVIPGLDCTDFLTENPNRHRYVCFEKI